MAIKNRVGVVEDILCDGCKHLTKHTVLASYDTHWGNGQEDDVFGGSNHEFLSCNGCGSATYRQISWNSEDDGPGVLFFPPRGQKTRAAKPFRHLPFDGPLEPVYHQTIKAFNEELPTLAGAGVRLCIEGVCKDRGIVDGPVVENGVLKRKTNLQGKINGLAEHGLISSQQAETLHQIRFLGNDAAHELDLPAVRVLDVALDIVEHIFEQVYEQPEKAKLLEKRKRP